MDVNEINKVATRKRMRNEVEKLRDKISKENKKIIKIKVAQDTAYWDLKEKLRQTETNHEKLQQNMLEVQMQYETVSGQYQDELRHRAEILNKLASTREICSVLEDYSERLRDTLVRCKADQACLYEAYQQSGQVMRELKSQQVQQNETSRRTIDSLQDKLKLTTDHHNQLLKYFNEDKQRFTAELEEEKRKLNSVLGKNNELLGANKELGALVDDSRRELEKKEQGILELQRDIKQLIQEFNSQASEMKSSMLKQEKELKEANASNDALKQALHNQENFTKSLCNQRNQLQEKLALIEEEQANTGNVVKELEIQLQDVNQAKEHFQHEVASLTEKNQSLEQEITTKSEVVTSLENEVLKLTDQIAALDLEKAEVISALEKAGVEAQVLVTRVQELTNSTIDMENKIQQIECAMKDSKETTEAKLKELNNLIEEKDKDLEAKTSTISNLMNEIKHMSDLKNLIEEKDKDLNAKTTTISQLMNEIKNMSDVRANLETAIKKMRQELMEEKEAIDAAGEREKRLSMKNEQLEVTIRKKEAELSSHLNIIMELRNDKDRLNGTIINMQSRIDNIQKELIRPAFQQPLRSEPELDDNAIMMLSPVTAGKRKQPSKEVEQAPFYEQDNDSLLFNFDENDAALVKRRFEMARGERFSPESPALKRSAPITQGGRRNMQNAKDEARAMLPLSDTKASEPNKRSFFKTKRRHDKIKEKLY